MNILRIQSMQDIQTPKGKDIIQRNSVWMPRIYIQEKLQERKCSNFESSSLSMKRNTVFVKQKINQQYKSIG